MKYPKIIIPNATREHLEQTRWAFMLAYELLEAGSETHICYAINKYAQGMSKAQLREMVTYDRVVWRARRIGVVFGHMIVRDGIGPEHLSFSRWFAANNPEHNFNIKVNGLGLTNEMYMRKLNARLEVFREHRIEWVKQIISKLNMKL